MMQTYPVQRPRYSNATLINIKSYFNPNEVKKLLRWDFFIDTVNNIAIVFIS